MRAIFVIDGFNLYHSVKQASRDLRLGGTGTKWLDLNALCSSYLHLLGKSASLSGIFYFSALATHIEAFKPDVTQRHRLYLRAIEDSGVRVELSRFKPKDLRCPSCAHKFRRHEEKETDVAIAAKLLEIFGTDAADTAVLVTGDTDLAPAVRTAISLYPSKKICFAFPYARKNKELSQLVPGCFQISKEAYANHQFQDPLLLSDGSLVAKPAEW